MKRKNVRVKCETGLHARPAAQFVQIANRYDSDIKIKKEKDEINGKSIMGVLMLAATHGTELQLIANGKDEDEAIEALSEYIENIK